MINVMRPGPALLPAFLALLMFAAARAAEPTSENDARLKEGLTRFPQADTDGDGILTQTEAKTFLARRGRQAKPEADGSRIPPDHGNVKYGPDERNVLDLWLAKRDDGKPTPVAVFIHGGGFSGGSKAKLNMAVVPEYRAAGVSVAAINYRLIDSGPFPMPMLDGARAIQFLRHHAAEYNLDKERFACFGGSAGGCMSMWLALHDDLADPDNPDPVLRESTRLTCAAPMAGQSSVDKATLAEWFHCADLAEHPSTRRFFGVDSLEELETPEKIALMKEASPITHLSPDDPPIFASYSQADTPVDAATPPGNWVHHPRLGIKLKEAMDRMGLECHVQYKGGPPVTEYRSPVDFVIRKLNGG
jgi:acetyl esterase/lipase